MPTMYIVDTDGNVLLTCGAGQDPLPDSIRLAMHELLAERALPEADRATMRVVDSTTAVRVLPARGALGDCAIVMIEPLNGRDYLRNAAERYALTPREQQVVKLIIEGRSTEEIASQLGITRNTVSLYVKSALAKTGSSSRAALLGRLMRPGPEFTQDRF